MSSELLKNETCKWCKQNLSRSFLTKVTMGVEKDDAIVYPVLCICGGITVIGTEVLNNYMREV